MRRGGHFGLLHCSPAVCHRASRPSFPPALLQLRRFQSSNSHEDGQGTARAEAGTTSTASASTPAEVSSRRLQLAIVGSGPSGFFLANHLTKKHPTLHVDMFERMPVPFGLCRYGVAPDHPDVKKVERQFMDLLKSGRVSWIGNVAVGRDIPVQAMLDHYAAVAFATGADSSHKMHIPGEELGGVVPARDFVSYYNTTPFPFGSPRFCPFDVERTSRVVIIGNGNVAMDVARIMAARYQYLCPTDMNCAAIKEMMKNRIQQIDIVARRGVEHSAFATAEFRELAKYQGSRVAVKVDHFDLKAAVAAVPATKNPRAHARMMELVHQYAMTAEQTAEEAMRIATTAEGTPLSTSAAEKAAAIPTPHRIEDGRGPCTAHFRYNLTPVALLPSPYRKNYVGGVLFRHSNSRAASASSTKETAPASYCVVPCDLVLTSIGYRSDGVAGVPFDEKAGVIPNDGGRVRGASRLYCSGWVKNGAKGVILHSTIDAQETASTMVADLEAGIIPSSATDPEEAREGGGGATAAATTTMYGKYGLVDYFVEKKLEPVSVAGVERIFHVEMQRGIDLGKRLEKVNAVRDMLDIALGGEVGKKADERIRHITPSRADAMLYLKELLDDDTDLAPLAHSLAKDLPHRLAARHPTGSIAPSQL